MSKGDVIISVDKIVKRWGGFTALNEVSVSFKEGEVVCIIGPSGSGKSTLLRTINRLEEHDAGRIVVDGIELDSDMKHIDAVRAEVGMVFQSFNLFTHMTVLDNITLAPQRVRKWKRERAEKTARELLERVGLAAHAHKYPSQLSGGQQQRVAIARALAMQPKVMLFDEPLGALDKKLREETQIELVNIIEQVGVTVVMVTHDQEEAMTMASRIAIMSEGNILQIGAPSEVYETPANRFVADFIGNVNLMDGTLIDDNPDHVIIECADCKHYVGHGITGNEGMPVSVAVRPEKIHVTRERPEGEYNHVRGTIKDMVYFGSHTVYHIQLGSGLVLKVSESNIARHRDDPLTWGDEVWASWTPLSQVVLTQ